MDTSSKHGGRPGLVAPSTALLIQKLGASIGPRRLTPSEIDLLRKSKQEIAARLLGREEG